MENSHFISQTALAPLPKANLEGRVIMADFAVFHERPNNSPHFVEPDQSGSESEDYLAGFEAGKAEASAVYEQTIKVMEDTLEQLKATLASKVTEIEQSHARVVFQSLEAVLPALAERSLLSDMQKVILQAASQEIEGVLTVRLHPNNETAKSFLNANAAGNVVIQDTPEQPETAVDFTWDVSRIEIDPQANARQCLALLSQAMPSPVSGPVSGPVSAKAPDNLASLAPHTSEALHTSEEGDML